MAIPREVIEEILYRTDIEELIGSYVTLTLIPAEKIIDVSQENIHRIFEDEI